MEEIEGCPFCGGSVKPWDTDYGVVSVVECKTCRTRFVFPYDRKGNALFEFWNRRAPTKHDYEEVVK